MRFESGHSEYEGVLITHSQLSKARNVYVCDRVTYLVTVSPVVWVSCVLLGQLIPSKQSYSQLNIPKFDSF
jgi:hypothetical protein